MAKRNKTYTDLLKEIEVLTEQAEAKKSQKLDVITVTLEKEFKKKYFQEQVITTDDAVLKKVVKNIVSDFSGLVEKAKKDLKEESEKTQSIASADVATTVNSVTSVAPDSALQ